MKSQRNETRINTRRSRGTGRTLFWGLALAALVLAIGAGRNGYGQSRRDHGPRGERGHRQTGYVSGHLSGHRSQDGGIGMDFAWALSGLDATEPQRRRILEITRMLDDDLAAMRRDQRRALTSMVAVLSADSLVEANLAAVRLEIDDLARRAVANSFDALMEIAEELTPEQRRRLISAWEEHR